MTRLAYLLLAIAIAAACLSFTPSGDFLSQQLQYARVKAASKESRQHLTDLLKRQNIPSTELQLLFVAFKAEGLLEMYGKKKSDDQYKLLTTYSICKRSGRLGPKRKQGDGQVPEGFYHIDRFNPSSSFYLSLGINYPNASDRLLCTAQDPGGDVFIHGSCVTIGCLPMTDDKIKEIYLAAVYARNNGQQKIPVYIFPFRMTETTFQEYSARFEKDTSLIRFWTNLKKGYDLFYVDKEGLQVKVNAKGDYMFN